MKSIELSIKDTIEASNKLAQKVEKEFKPDVVIFISKGSYLIGDTISKHFNVPLIEIYAVRDGNKFKEIISPILKIIPKNIKNFLRKKELESGIHSKKIERKVYLEKGFNIIEESKTVLIVDDSVDTGYTAKQVCTYVANSFKNKTVRFASFNLFEESEKVFQVDYSLYKNHIMIGPWSKDSIYYSEFLKRYEEWKER